MKLLSFSKNTEPWSRQVHSLHPSELFRPDKPENWKADHGALKEENMKHSTSSEYISFGYSVLAMLDTLLGVMNPIFLGLKEPYSLTILRKDAWKL